MPPQIPSDQSYCTEQAYSNGTHIGEAPPLPPNQHRPAPEPPRPPMARRSILRGIAGVGAVGAAAAAGAGAIVALDRQSAQPTTLKPVSKPVAVVPMAPTAMAGPLVVYIADTSTGQFDVFGGTGQTRVRNPALVSQLLANLKLA